MGKIIERDFFPDLEKLHAQNDYLDALDKNDISKLREIHAKYTSGGSRPPTSRYSSPATFDTPIDTRLKDDNSLREGLQTELGNLNITTEIKKKIFLDEYLSSHTSEDNQSFEEIIKESETRHQQKHAWLYKNETTNSDVFEKIGKQALDMPRPLEIDTWGYKNKNYIMFVPDGADLTPDEKVEMAKRKQEVIHGNTRLKAVPFDENRNKEKIQGLAQSQARSMDGKIGVDGKEVVTQSPKVNGYGFVKTPSPAPGIEESPLMTWGEIEGTPFRLDGGDTPLHSTPGPSYRVNEQHRDRKRKAIEAAKRQLTPSTGGGLDRLQAMSPAARRLATSQLRRRLGSEDRALVASYSPARPSPRRDTPRHFISFFFSCCVDEVAAEHVKADAIIHYGHACLSPVTRLPVLYVFPKATLDTTKFYNGLKALDPEVSSTLILYDVAYQHKSDVNFTHYTEETSFIHLNTVNVLKQCSYLVERLRDSTNVGLLVGTLGIKGCLEAIAHVKKLCKHGNKKTYVFSVGKPNPAKLANFPEIDVFVAISCMEANFGDRKSYMQPIVGVFEVELAFNENRTWLSSYSRDFRALIPGNVLNHLLHIITCTVYFHLNTLTTLFFFLVFRKAEAIISSARKKISRVLWEYHWHQTNCRIWRL
ncbi:hypothetical protein AAG570_011912 [Ranatra chinensis]|uniref:2-(3-amino-3-carboxypropyl)histidine synthase subunit 2 n=1 Tax=Ranatra chinensis TaxID=642074 RepID=A0ABD0YH99_9HEMI